jgi:hypothetical protein
MLKFSGTVDYRLAWRWLLPYAPGCSLSIHGFSDVERSFLQRRLTDPQTPHGEDTALLIRDIRPSGQVDIPQSCLQSAKIVSVLADRLQGKLWRRRLKEDFPWVREYALLPPDNPRVVVPIASKHTATALNIHRPGRSWARLALGFAKVLTKLGNHSLLRGRVLLTAVRGTPPEPMGWAQAAMERDLAPGDLSYALYLGTPDDNRKTVVLLLDQGGPTAILKQAESPKALRSLNNEAETLTRLTITPVADSVPRLLQSRRVGDCLTLFQEYRSPRRGGARRLEVAVAAFLEKLSRVDSQQTPLADLLAELPENCCSGWGDVGATACRSLYSRLQLLSDAGTVLLTHRGHGDFAPWNCSWTASGLFVFDWEDSRKRVAAFSDAFYYAIAPAVELGTGIGPGKLLSDTLQLAWKINVQDAGAEMDRRVYLALWLIGRKKKSQIYAGLMTQLVEQW